MNATVLASLLGGLGLFLLGMGLMTDGLRIAAGGTLKSILDTWAQNAIRGFLAGFLITAVVQSSSAVVVATIGFVNAGLLSLAQAIWVVIGTNVGTTMTGWLVALVGIKVDVGTLALPLIGIGMLVRLLAGGRVRPASLGQAVAGFGAFFLGIGIFQDGFSGLAPGLLELDFGPTTWLTALGFVGLGMLLTVLTQSSSAAIAIILTASTTGSVPLVLAGAAVVGTNIGTTSTAVLAAVAATPAARRVATAHILFNVITGTVALILLSPLLVVSRSIAGLLDAEGSLPTVLAVFHTTFNLLGSVLIWLVRGPFVRLLASLYVSPAEQAARPAYLDPTLTSVPALALSGLVLELQRTTDMAFRSARQRVATPPSDPALPLNEEVVIGHLARQIRTFIGRLGASPLPDTVVSALPDLIRAVQHVEDLIAAGRGVHKVLLPEAIATGDAWHSLLQATRHSLTLYNRSIADEAATGRLGEQARRAEAAYQNVKAELLHAAAVGEMPVEAMEDALTNAQALRRCADIAFKIQRRLRPWSEEKVDGDDEQGLPGPQQASCGRVNGT
ncbi:Na/Pi cotransporter family protein [Xanthobacter sp. ZOL 2024]